jgi:hypothetical protein
MEVHSKDIATTIGMRMYMGEKVKLRMVKGTHI